jgi:hypothetical protein
MPDKKELVQELLIADMAVEACELELKEKKKIQREKEKALADQMIAEGISEFTLDQGEKVRIDDNVYPTVKKENQKDLFLWLEDIDRGDAIKTSVHNRTLRSIVKSQIEEGKPLPDFVEINHSESKVKITHGRKSLRKGNNLIESDSEIF